MPRALSWAVIAAAFLAGLYLPDAVARLAVPPRAPASTVALPSAAEGEGPVPPFNPLTPGDALKTGPDGKVTPVSPDLITALNVRDPTALVMSSEPGACSAKPVCACEEDDLHRYQPKKKRRKDFEALRGPDGPKL
jgi:hypothetical protein